MNKLIALLLFACVTGLVKEGTALRCKGIDGGCCTKENPCEKGDGDCDSDDQCAGGLTCGNDNCPKKAPWDRDDDCCEGEKYEDKCKVKNGGCSHTCVSVKGVAKCSCPKYTRLGADKKTCEAPTKSYKCAGWSDWDKKAMGKNPSVQKQKYQCERHPGQKFTKGNSKLAPGCPPGCWCCKPVYAPAPYTCYGWSKLDKKAMGKNPPLKWQKDQCERYLGHKFTKGNYNKAPGCGKCHCCKLVNAPKSYTCYGWSKWDKKALGKNPPVAWQKGQCERYVGYRFTQGNAKKAPGCSKSCWCCKPVYG